MLQLEAEFYWRSAEGEDFPLPRDSKIILFTSFLEYGLLMHARQFLEGLLFYYKIQLHNLTLESILHISVSMHFCEAFFGN